MASYGHTHKERGAVIISFALMLTILIGFLALGVEVGQWYLARAELSKAVDAAAMAGANNISNPFVNLTDLVVEIGNENFPPGYVGTQENGTDHFTSSYDASDQKISVNGSATSVAALSRIFGMNLLPISASGAARKNRVEIMLVLDRSGSMKGTPLGDLKTAAKAFLDYFEDTQNEDQLGLISFGSGVTVNQRLGVNNVTAMRSAVNALAAKGATNAEDAIDQADGPLGFSDQTGVPGNARVQQYLIFFSDGHPTAFRNTFVRNNTTYDAVTAGTGQTCGDVSGSLFWTDSENEMNIDPLPTGDGKTASQSACHQTTVRWNVLDRYPIQGYTADSCNINRRVLAPFICSTARQMAIAHAQELKDKNIRIFTIGLGSIDRELLSSLASGADYVYYTPTSDQLTAIFNRIAKEIKLRLVE